MEPGKNRKKSHLILNAFYPLRVHNRVYREVIDYNKRRHPKFIRKTANEGGLGEPGEPRSLVARLSQPASVVFFS
jgi:hypothetical protein